MLFRSLADFLFEELEIFGFVAEAELLNDLHVGRFPFWDVALTASGGEFEFGEVAAGEVIAHVGGGEPDFAVYDAHRRSLPVWRRLGEEGRKRRKGVYPPGVFARVGKLFRMREISGF